MQKPSIVGLIPSRMESTRLPGKPLACINGIPMISRVHTQTLKSNSLDYVGVCTDSTDIFNLIKSNGGNALLTRTSHENGTSRIAEVIFEHSFFDATTTIVDVQGDDPMVDPDRIDSLIAAHVRSGYDITVSVGLPSKSELLNPNVVKVIGGEDSRIYAMTRCSGFPHPFRHSLDPVPVFKHLSTIAFTREGLRHFHNASATVLERVEGIELLRALSLGVRVGYHVTSPTISVDTPSDLETVRSLLRNET